MFRLPDKCYAGESVEAEVQALREEARLEAQRTDDPCVEAEFGPLVPAETWDGLPPYAVPPEDPYEQAAERYRGIEA